ncbi:MAG: hypothetical protein LGL72_17940 [Acidibrevibacterium sp.]|uniref:hypothetical protein n=1 Tax=Acidibrevibacterium fodinaquatile TaxID=1969806 RepID=UPI0023A8A8C4|nr:hypothetical protein [Acidibrevibacterium fodinaquatile]MCA7121227.1 hypothetical protein [Acidibrevibacterium fodinaquatile]
MPSRFLRCEIVHAEHDSSVVGLAGLGFQGRLTRGISSVVGRRRNLGRLLEGGNDKRQRVIFLIHGGRPSHQLA